MDKKDLLSQQLDSVSLDALNTPSKAQEQLQETSQEAHNLNKKDSTQVYMAKIYQFQMYIEQRTNSNFKREKILRTSELNSFPFSYLNNTFI